MRLTLLILAGWIMMLSPEGRAGSIQLQPDVSVEVTNGHPYAVVEVFNGGDEPARITGLEAGLSAGRKVGRTLSRTVSPGGVIHERIPVPAPSGLPGFYQGITRIRYADFTGGNFTSVSVSGFSWPRSDSDGLSHWVVPSVSQISMGRVGTLRVSLLLIQDDPVSATVRLVLPDELDCPASEQRVVLEPDSTREVTFEVTNRRARPGGVYPVYAIVEQEAAGLHRSASAAGTVTVADIKWVGQSPWVWLAGAFSLVALLGLGMRGRRVSRQPAWIDPILLALFSGFILWQVSPGDLIRNTTAVGGDTPAHLYLVSHLKEQLFHHGRLISWADGWWGGFPMFQYYFVLPYLVAALMSVLIPLSVAFKLVSVAGLVMTPLCAYWAGTLWRLPRPVPLVLSMAMLPFLFVQSHTMWGVNTASTLAGMISNSWSFALMLPALASASRDVVEGRFRVGTVFLMVLVLSSHFFTSVMMFLSLSIVPVLCRRKERLRALKVLLLEGLLALLIMAWWLIPLVVKSEFSMDFGTNWDVTLWKSFPPYSVGLIVLAILAVWLEGHALSWPMTGGRDKARPSNNAAVWMLLWMLLSGILLFKVGFALSPVFVNVRLWPYIFFALIALAALGLGRLLQSVPGLSFWLVVLAGGVFCGVMVGDSLTGRPTDPGLTRMWAKWNFSGLEDKPAAAVFEKLVMPLKGTPGRLANDLCEENNQLGSSRIFELAPVLAGKPVLEGGLVNSALGSMYAYTIQGESSVSCAGFPVIVTPQPFNFTNATRHLELFNVKQFIARSEQTKQALRQQPGWRLVGREQEWELHELTTHAGRFVFVPPRMPLVVMTSRWKECSLQWLTTIQAMEQFVIWRKAGEQYGDGGMAPLTEKQFLDCLEGWRQGSTNGLGPLLPPSGTDCISSEEVSDNGIRFMTSAIGSPHIVKVSWFPNWKVRGARGVYRVSPGFMLVYPEQKNVELYYGTTWSDGVGYALTVVGFLGVVLLAVKKRGRDGL
jgi:hypothetical protein